MQFFVSHLFIILTVVFAVSSQLIIKWQMSQYSFSSANTIFEKFYYALGLLQNPFILSSIALTLLSGLSWMIAMSKFEISYAYPYTSLGFILVLLFSHIFFNEPITVYKFFGVLLIVVGIFIISRDFS
jgi:multidrug transporter EmrE-like cation transporter